MDPKDRVIMESQCIYSSFLTKNNFADINALTVYNIYQENNIYAFYPRAELVMYFISTIYSLLKYQGLDTKMSQYQATKISQYAKLSPIWRYQIVPIWRYQKLPIYCDLLAWLLPVYTTEWWPPQCPSSPCSPTVTRYGWLCCAR